MFHILVLLASTVGIALGQTTPECSASVACPVGCCSQYGICGTGPDYCGSTCANNCYYKAECDPGGWGSAYSSATTCPLNVCCSKFGFCGTTTDFCGSTPPPTPPSCGSGHQLSRTVAYYEGWSLTRSCDSMGPEDLILTGVTHVNYAFALIDPNSFAVAPMSSDDPALYRRTTGLKSKYPGLKVYISIGGWAMNSAGQPTATSFTDLAASTSAQSQFFSSLLSFMQTYGFDGVDLDWEYPVAPERFGNADDFANYPTFLSNLRSALNGAGNYGLTITTPAEYWYLQDFDIVKLADVVDWFNVMDYDLHGTWDATDEWVGPYIGAHTNLTEIDQGLSLFWRNNIDPSKITMGLGFYGRSFTLTDPSCNTAGCEFSGAGNPGECTQTGGILAYAEIAEIVRAGATVTLDEKAAVKIATWDENQWVGYDDPDTLALKLAYAESNCLGGVMVWAIDLDAPTGDLSLALAGESAPPAGGNSSSYSKVSKLQSRVKSSVGDPLKTCTWSTCGPLIFWSPSSTCLNQGYADSAAAYIDTESCNGGARILCCPSDDIPTCIARDGANPNDPSINPFTFLLGKANCMAGEVNMGTIPTFGGLVETVCCTATASTAAEQDCSWTDCGEPCSGEQPNLLGTTAAISGTVEGYPTCPSGQIRNYCCSSPKPYAGCSWEIDLHTSGDPEIACDTSCPGSSVTIAQSPCASGANVFCCQQPDSTTPTSSSNNSSPWEGPGPADAGFCVLDTDLIFLEAWALADFKNADQGDDDPEQTNEPPETTDKRSIDLSNATHWLEKRGGPRSFKIYAAVGSLWSLAYNSLSDMAADDPYLPVLAIDASSQCATWSVQLFSFAGKPVLTDYKNRVIGYVVEHPFELQSLAMFWRSLANDPVAKLQLGATFLTQNLGAPVPNNIISPMLRSSSTAAQVTWQALGINLPGSPATDLWTSLGAAAFTVPFIGAPSHWNSFKKLFFQQSTIISATKWANADYSQRLALTTGIYQTMSYMQHPTFKQAFQGVVTGIRSVLRTYSSIPGMNIDLVHEFDEFLVQYLTNCNTVWLAQMKEYLFDIGSMSFIGILDPWVLPSSYQGLPTDWAGTDLAGFYDAFYNSLESLAFPTQW